MTIPRLTDDIRLVATRTAISRAGLFVASILTRWRAQSILLDAVSVTEELVTSARHAGKPEAAGPGSAVTALVAEPVYRSVVQ